MAEANLSRALEAIDAAHAEDPNLHTTAQGQIPYELHYAQKSTYYLEKRMPEATAVLKTAVRAQHLRRWETPRSSYPMNKVGYLSWRASLKKSQAALAHSICVSAGYTDLEADRVASLIRKENLTSDEETQALEDVACLVFLDDQLEGFEKDYDEEKVISILRKTWGKMSEKGRELALSQVELGERGKELVGKALGA